MKTKIFFRSGPDLLIISLALISVAIHMLVANNLGYHRDEMLYFTLGQHPAYGYNSVPPVIGWVAVRNDLGPPAWALFFILYFWQMPHFLALAWMYRQDYARGGFKTLTVVDPGGRVVRRQETGEARELAQVQISSLPVWRRL